MYKTQKTAVLALSIALGASQLFAQGNSEGHGQFNDGHNRRVLLISIDGMHAVDYENCVAKRSAQQA